MRPRAQWVEEMVVLDPNGTFEILVGVVEGILSKAPRGFLETVGNNQVNRLLLILAELVHRDSPLDENQTPRGMKHEDPSAKLWGIYLKL